MKSPGKYLLPSVCLDWLDTLSQNIYHCKQQKTVKVNSYSSAKQADKWLIYTRRRLVSTETSDPHSDIEDFVSLSQPNLIKTTRLHSRDGRFQNLFQAVWKLSRGTQLAFLSSQSSFLTCFCRGRIFVRLSRVNPCILFVSLWYECSLSWMVSFLRYENSLLPLSYNFVKFRVVIRWYFQVANYLYSLT